MPRYGINVNYAPSKWDRAQQGIGAAISAYQQQQDADRAESNQINAQGGVPTGAAPATIGSRARQVAGFLRKKVLGQTDPGAPVAPVDASSVPVTTQLPAVAGVTQQGGASLLGGATPAQAAAPRRIGEAIMGDPAQIAAQQNAPFMPGAPPPPAGGTPASTAPASGTPVVRSGAGNLPTPPAAAAAPAASSIGAALSPYTVTARNGQQYTIDPNRQANAARATKRAELQDEIELKGADRDKDRQAQIQALIDSGMPPATARAKVLNNVVKYDEQFGQPRTQITQKDRLAIQDRIDKRASEQRTFAMRLEELRQHGRTNTREFQELSIKLRQQAQEDANDRALLSADEAESARADRTVTTLQTNPIVSSTPEGQKQITTAQQQADEAKRRASESRRRVEGKRPGATGAKPVISQQQYDAARAKINPATKQPYTDAEIAQFYDIHPTVKRK